MIHTRSHISKLWDILPSLSIKLSFLNMIQTISQISKLGAFFLVCQEVRISSQEHVSIITPKNIDLQSYPNFSKNIIAFSSFCWFGKTLNHFISSIAFRRIQPYKLQEKCKYVYKGLMTLIPSKWKRTVLFCNLRVCQHVFPRKQKFLKIFVYITNCIHLKNEFSKWFTKSIFSFLKDFLQKRYTTKV